MTPITLPIAELKPALKGLGKLVSTRSSTPIHQFVKIDRTTEGWIALTTTDSEHFITVRLEQPSTGKPLSMLVPYEGLVALTRNSSNEGQLNLIPDLDQQAILVAFAAIGKAGPPQMKTMPVSEFPVIPQIPGKPVPLPPVLRQSIHEAMDCAGEDPTRRILHGALIDVSQPKSQYVVATDGKHLYTSNSFRLPLKESLIIPKHKFLGWRDFNNDGEWQMKTSGPWLQINTRRWRFISRQIEGSYPKWRQVLPDTPVKTTITLDPQTLDALMQTIENLPCHDEKYGTIGIQYKEGQVHLLAKEGSEEPWMPVPINPQKVEGREVTIFVNRHLMNKALQFGLNTISLVDEMSPLRFSREGRQMILMPLREEPDRQAPRQISARDIAKSRPPLPRPAPPSEPRTLEAALAQIEAMKNGFREGLNGLTRLSEIVSGVLRK